VRHERALACIAFVPEADVLRGGRGTIILVATVTSTLRRRVVRDFRSDAAQVLNQLEDIPECAPLSDLQDPERLQAACVLPAKGDLGQFRELVITLNADWRDLLVGAGLAQPDWPLRLDSELGPSDD
jgi:hypothetical protein